MGKYRHELKSEQIDKNTENDVVIQISSMFPITNCETKDCHCDAP